MYVLFKACIQSWHHSHADIIWPDGTFKEYTAFFSLEFIGPIMIFKEMKMVLDVRLWRMTVWILYERKINEKNGIRHQTLKKLRKIYLEMWMYLTGSRMRKSVPNQHRVHLQIKQFQKNLLKHGPLFFAVIRTSSTPPCTPLKVIIESEKKDKGRGKEGSHYSCVSWPWGGADSSDSDKATFLKLLKN